MRTKGGFFLRTGKKTVDHACGGGGREWGMTNRDNMREGGPLWGSEKGDR